MASPAALYLEYSGFTKYELIGAAAAGGRGRAAPGGRAARSRQGTPQRDRTAAGASGAAAGAAGAAGLRCCCHPPALASPLRPGSRGPSANGRSCSALAPAASTSRRLPGGSRGLTQSPRSTARPASPGARRLGLNKIADAPGDLPRCLHCFLSGTRRPCRSAPDKKKSAPGPRGHSLASVYKPPLWREKEKNTLCPPPPLTSPPPAAPSHRSRRRCRGCHPGAPRQGIFAPSHCSETERDGREITARRDPCGGDTVAHDGRLTVAGRCLRRP